MFTDEAQIHIKSGHGGLGGKHFLREKNRPMGGPAGGDGGDGGSIYVVARTKLTSLSEFRFRKEFIAPDGENGQRNKMAGKNGADLTIEVPCGTLIKNQSTKKLIIDLIEPDRLFLLAKGGKGGLGNYHFSTSRKQAPTYAQPGLPGTEYHLDLELKLIADLGIVGLPNAGKSTLLKLLTNANPKIASYPFTTLHPNLGILNIHNSSFVLADIPGLIEGAAQGIGLGDDFLRHIERTSFILHIVDVSGFSGDPLKNFKTINQELKNYSVKLAHKKQLIVLNKTDVPESCKYLQKFLKHHKTGNFLEISAVTGKGQKELKEKIFRLMKKA